MKKAIKILCGITGVLALMEVSGMLGEAQGMYAIWELEPKATERALNILSDKDLHKHLNIGPYTSAKCRFISRFAKDLISINK